MTLLLSVVIPTCHRNEDLAKCLDCLAPGVQAFVPGQYEVIVTDDGRNSTAEAMVLQHFSWACWTAGPCRGPAANRNHGASIARGEWLIFTDDDCLPMPGWLSAFMQARSTVDVLEGLTKADREQRSLAEEAPINLTGGYLWSCNFAIRRTIFDQLNGFDENFPAPAMEDCDFRERLKAQGIPFEFVTMAEVVHPWRMRRGIEFWEVQHKALVNFLKKHPDAIRDNIAIYYVQVALRSFLVVLKSLGCGKFEGLGHESKHAIWLLLKACRIAWM